MGKGQFFFACKEVGKGMCGSEESAFFLTFVRNIDAANCKYGATKEMKGLDLIFEGGFFQSQKTAVKCRICISTLSIFPIIKYTIEKLKMNRVIVSKRKG